MCRSNRVPHPQVKSLKLGYWNIHGWSSKIIGNKLTDLEFLQKISKCDIIGLSEIHSDKEVSIPGFISLKQKIREKKNKGPKIAGGIGVFVKEDSKHLVQVIPNKNQDSIWIKIKKEFCDENEDIFLGSYYVSPEKKTEVTKNDFFNVINEEINVFKDKGIVLVQGDLNARTGSQQDYIELDKFDNIFGVENFSNQKKRNSEDKKTDRRGKELLDICKVNDMLITNGRKVGDLFGKFTSHQWNGSALNDYLLAPCNFIHKILDFNVGEYVPWLSDHCPIYNIISLNNLMRNENVAEKPIESEPNFIFDKESRDRFLVGLNSHETSKKMLELLANENISALKMGTDIKEMLIENAKNCKIKTKKTRLMGHRHLGLIMSVLIKKTFYESWLKS